MNSPTPSIADKRARFRRLHQAGCFVIPNPWDLGSARYLQTLGFPALATTSSGFAWSRAHADGVPARELVLQHLREMVEGTDVPVNADFQAGFAHSPAGVADSVRLAVDSGVAGLSIEDSTGDAARPLYAFDEAVARVRAAREAIDASGADVMLVGRAECFLVGRPLLDETALRLKAYADAGADCLYAPGIRSAEEVSTLVAAVAPKPLNLLISGPSEWTVARAAQLGVRRISVGGALARVAWGAFMRAAQLLATEGEFSGFAEAASGQKLNSLFGEAR